MKPKFIEHIHLDIPKDLTPKEDALGNIMCDITNKIMVEQVEKIDNKICERIKDIAILNGIDEIYILDRNAIISALKKQIPKKPKIKVDYDGTLWGENIVGKYGYCPCCEQHLISTLNNECVSGQKDKYCSNCGQALDWSDTE